MRGGQDFGLFVTGGTTNAAPIASFTATPASGTAPLTVNLDASAATDSDGSIRSYAWSSSDGQSKNGKLVSFEFSSAGAPVITLTVTDNQGATHSTQKTISVSAKPVVNKAPVASFSATPQSGSAPLTVNLDASASSDSDGSISSYAWSSSDGKTSSGKLASFEFSSAGAPVITLTVTDNQGATHSTQKTLSVSAKPTPTPTPTGNGNGYIEGKVSDGCSYQALPDIKVQVGTEQDRTDEQGQYKLKLPFGHYKVQVAESSYNAITQDFELARESKPSAFADFRLSPPGGCAALGRAYRYKAIVVAGSGPTLAGGKVNHVWESTQSLASQAYLALRQQGFAADRIRFLSVQPQAQDVDNDKLEDIAGVATADSLQSALNWASEGDTQDVVVYLIGHGYADRGNGYFVLNPSSPLTSAQLKSQLDALQSKLSGTLSVVLDACYSGSFLKPLAAAKRYVVTSTSDDRNAVLDNKGINSFSNYFWKTVGLEAGNLGAGFAEAKQAMSSVEVDNVRKLRQDAQVDANGDGLYTQADNAIIGKYCYGACKYPEHLGIAPTILSVGPETELVGQRSRRLSVQSDKPLAKAWVNMQRPDYHYPAEGSPLASFLRIDLACNGTSCSAVYDNFNLNDNYTLTYFAEDAEGNQAAPRSVSLQQSGFDEALNSRKKTAAAVYEPGTGVLTLQDVLYADQHYYVELRDADQAQNGYGFSVQYFYPLTEATATAVATFDGKLLSVPEVLLEGQMYSNINFDFSGGVFRLQ